MSSERAIGPDELFVATTENGVMSYRRNEYTVAFTLNYRDQPQQEPLMERKPDAAIAMMNRFRAKTIAEMRATMEALREEMINLLPPQEGSRQPSTIAIEIGSVPGKREQKDREIEISFAPFYATVTDRPVESGVADVTLIREYVQILAREREAQLCEEYARLCRNLIEDLHLLD